MKNLKTLNEYGGSEWSVITAAKNFLYIDMGKFRDKLKDRKHLKEFDKAKKAFWDVVGNVAEEHHEMYESKLTEGELTEGNNTQYSWGQINDALTSMGMSPRKIGDIRLFLKKQK